MSLIKKIKDYYKKPNSLLFTTPSHAQGNFVIPKAEQILGTEYFKSDFSEIEGFDNLRAPQNTIKSLLKHISDIYQSKASFMLINGSTSGIIAAMLTVLKDNDKVLVARNCHISVYNGLVLTGAVPVWFTPAYEPHWGIYKGVKAADIELYLKHNKDIKALIITSPTYEGIFSNISEISEVCKKHNVILIVDEAHGALLNFGSFKSKPAIQLGADISIQSLHKTAGGINPSALLHISKSSDILPQNVQTALNLINTTSPSYPLMADIEATVNYLYSSKGKNHISSLLKYIKHFKMSLPHGIDAYSDNNDPTKILLKFSAYNADNIAEILNKKFNIEEEYSTEKAMLFITGIGTTSNALKHLLEALKAILNEADISCSLTNSFYLHQIAPNMQFTPRTAHNKPKKLIQKNKSAGQVCGECIIKYPPGIPLLLPGEIIQPAFIPFIEKDEILII